MEFSYLTYEFGTALKSWRTAVLAFVMQEELLSFTLVPRVVKYLSKSKDIVLKYYLYIYNTTGIYWVKVWKYIILTVLK